MQQAYNRTKIHFTDFQCNFKINFKNNMKYTHLSQDEFFSPPISNLWSFLELVYAAESYKKIIPLTLEPRYNPHGWLRFHTSDGLRYDFSSDDSFEDSFKKLLRVLKKCYSGSGTCCHVTRFSSCILECQLVLSK